MTCCDPFSDDIKPGDLPSGQVVVIKASVMCRAVLRVSHFLIRLLALPPSIFSLITAWQTNEEDSLLKYKQQPGP